MNAAKQLLQVLKQENTAIRERQFESMGDLLAKKESLVEQVDQSADEEILSAIRQQAEENEQLLTVMANAARGLRTRFEMMAKAANSVAYEEDGTRLSCGDENPSHRV